MTTALLLLALLILSSSSQPFAHGQAVVATEKDGGYSVDNGVAYDSGKGEIFVTNYFNKTVDVFSDSNNALVATITAGYPLGGIVYDPAKNELFAAGASTLGGLAVISDSTNKVIANLSSISPYTTGAVGYDPAKGEIFLGVGGSRIPAGSVSIISDVNDSVVATVSVGNDPSGFAYDSAKGEMFVSNYGDDTVSVISDSNDSVVATVPVGAGPWGLAYDSAMGEVFVANSGGSNVSVISDATDTVVATVPVVLGPSGVAYDQAKGEVYVTNAGNDTTITNVVSIISDASNSVVDNLVVGAGPTGIAYDPAKGELFVSLTNSIAVISDSAPEASSTASTVSTTASARSATSSCTYTPGSLGQQNNLSDTCTFTYNSATGQGGPGTVGVGPYPVGLAYDSGNGEVYVADYSGPSVTVISDSNNSVVATIALPGLNAPGFQGSPSPDFVAYDSGKGEIFVTETNDDCVVVISDTNNSVVATIGLGNLTANDGQGVDPGQLAYDSAMGEIFVADQGQVTINGTHQTSQSAVSVISDATNAVVATVPMGDGVGGIAYDSAKGEVFVATANATTSLLSVISDKTNAVVANIPVYGDYIVYDSAKGELFMTDGASVTVVSDATNTVVATIPVANYSDTLAYDSGKGEVFVLPFNPGDATIISAATNSVIGTVAAGPEPSFIAYDSGKGELFVTESANDTVDVISDSASHASSSAVASSTSSSKSSSSSLQYSFSAMVAVEAGMIGIVALAVAKRRYSRGSLAEG